MTNMWTLNSKMLSKKGFTLMELIVVTVIISILFTISYTSYKGYHRKSRVYSAKKDLSSIVSMAEVFKANTGFYLPNLSKMHIPIMGRYFYNYKVLCYETDGTTVNWSTSATGDTCGGFKPAKTSSTPPNLDISDSCTDAQTKCWMGAVLCHHYSEGTSILCGSKNYTFQFENRGVMQWKNHNDDWTNSSNIVEEMEPLFYIVDFASVKDPSASPHVPHCKRVSRTDDVFTDSSNCFFNKEFAVNSSDIPSIIQAQSSWTSDQESFISTPFKLVITALACKDKQDDCTGTSFDYSIIRMDTNRLVQIIQ